MKDKKPMIMIAIGMGKKPKEKMMGGGMTYAKGGMTKSGGRDGCATKGKTKGRMV